MQSRQRKGGFTLMEMLLVVGILVVLLALSVLAISGYTAQLRQKEMDAKAQQIYMAAQNRMAILRANGCEDAYQDPRREGVTSLPYVPRDADTGAFVSGSELYFVTSGHKENPSSAAGALLPAGCIDHSLWQNHWIIEYDPASGHIYAVFYWEEPLEEYTVEGRDLLRSRQERQSRAKGYVGYYGGHDAEA